MAIAGLGRPVANHQGTVAHTGSNPGAPRSNTSTKGQEQGFLIKNLLEISI